MKKKLSQLTAMVGGALVLCLLVYIFQSLGWLSLGSFADVTQGTLSAPGSIVSYTVREAVESIEQIGREMIIIDGRVFKEDPVDNYFFLKDDTGMIMLDMGSYSSLTPRTSEKQATVYGTLGKRGDTDILMVDKIDYHR